MRRSTHEVEGEVLHSGGVSPPKTVHPSSKVESGFSFSSVFKELLVVELVRRSVQETSAGCLSLYEGEKADALYDINSCTIKTEVSFLLSSATAAVRANKERHLISLIETSSQQCPIQVPTSPHVSNSSTGSIPSRPSTFRGKRDVTRDKRHFPVCGGVSTNFPKCSSIRRGKVIR